MTDKYPTPAQKAAGYVQTKDIIARQYLRAMEKSVVAWTVKSPKYQRTVDDMILYGTSMYLVTEADAEASVEDAGKFLSRLP